MRWGLYGLSLFLACLLWLLVKLDQRHVVKRTLHLAMRGQEVRSVEVQAEGPIYALLLWKLPDTLSLARYCFAPPVAPAALKVSWPSVGFLCEQLRREAYRPKLHWVLPEGTDFVEPPRWVVDSLWVGQNMSLPPWEVSLVAQRGKQMYPVPLPPQWYTYPETLWVEANVDRFVFASITLLPRLEGVKGYKVLLNPARVEVRFWVPERQLGAYQPEDFELVLRMDKVLPSDTVVYPELLRYPPFIRQVEVVPAYLNFARIY